MKKIFLFCLLVTFLGTIGLFAQQKEIKQQNQEQVKDWDFFQLVFLPGIPSYAENSLVYGWKLGAPISDGYNKVCGLESAIFSSMTDNVDGMQTSGLFVLSKKMNGLQFSPVNVANEQLEGCQLGLVNYSEKSGFQIGVANYMKDGFLPFFPIINFSVK